MEIANFIQMGVGMFAFALGVFEVVDNAVGAVLVRFFGLGLIVAGTFRPDPLRGYPPDANQQVSWRGQLHNATGPLMFLALFAKCLTLAGFFQSGWRVYTVVTAVLGLVLTGSTAVSFQRDAAHTGTVQRALILVYWAWIILTGIHLTTSSPPL